MTALPELFRHYPALRTKLPWTALARPTPVQALDCLPGAGRRLWIKRDDRTNDVYGGHEARELEFVFGDALRRGARRLLAFGHVSSSQGLALATLGRAFEMEIVLALAGPPESPKTQRLLELERRQGATLHCLHGRPWEALKLLRTCMTPGGKRGRPRFPTVLWPQKARLLSTLGAINGVFELQRQIRCGILPEPEKIYVGSPSLPTLAGLAAGCELAGLRSQLVTTRQEQVRPAWLLARRALRDLAGRVRDLPRADLRSDRIECRLPAAHVEGTRAGPHLPDVVEGLALQSPTSMQAMQALLAEPGRREARGPRLFWHADGPPPVRTPQAVATPLSPAHA
jgi:D-cysteine desulfhydrase